MNAPRVLHRGVALGKVRAQTYPRSLASELVGWPEESLDALRGEDPYRYMGVPKAEFTFRDLVALRAAHEAAVVGLPEQAQLSAARLAYWLRTPEVRRLSVYITEAESGCCANTTDPPTGTAAVAFIRLGHIEADLLDQIVGDYESDHIASTDELLCEALRVTRRALDRMRRGVASVRRLRLVRDEGA